VFPSIECGVEVSDDLSERSSLSVDGVIEEQQQAKRVDQRIASELGTIFNQLDRLVTMMRVYPKGHPILDEIAQGIISRIRPAIATFGDLEINLGATELQTAGGTAFFSAMQSERQQFIYYNTYADGVIRVEFHEGVTSKDLQDFLGVVNRASQGAIGSDDDSVTLLWELNLDSISYVAVEGFVDTGAMESFGDMNEAEATQVVADAAIEPRGAAAAKLAAMFSNLNLVHLDLFTRMQVTAQAKMAVPALSDHDLAYAFGVDNTVISKLMGEWSSGVDLEYRLIEALLSIVRTSPHSEEGRNAARLVMEVTHNLLDKDLFAQAARVLELLHDRKELFANLDYDPMGDLINELSDPMRLEALIYMMQTNTAKRHELVSLLLMLGPTKVQWQILQLLSDEKRKVVAIPQMVDVLLKTLQPDNESQFLSKEVTTATYFKRLLPVLADRDPESFKPMPRLIRAALHLEDREVLKTALLVEHSVWKDDVLADKYLQPLSSHDDEELRKLALRRLGEHHTDRFRAAIRESVLARKFTGRTHAELRFLMRIFLESDGDSAQQLRNLLDTRGWLNKAHREFAKMAAAVLLEFGDEESLAFITERSESATTHADLRDSWKNTLARFSGPLSTPELMNEESDLDPLMGQNGPAERRFIEPDKNNVFFADGVPEQGWDDGEVLVGTGDQSESWDNVPGLDALKRARHADKEPS
jgi:hypothetical protein